MSKPYTSKLSTIGDVIQGQSPKSEYYSNSEGTPFLQGNRTFGYLYPFFDTYTKKVTKLAKKGDVLMSVRAPVGALNFAPCDLCIGRGLASIRSKNKDSKFIYYTLKHNVNNLIRQAGATTFDSVNRDLILNFDLVIPRTEEDRKLVSQLLSNLDQKIERNNKINDELETMAKLLYDYWFVQFDFPDENGKPYKSSGGKMVWCEELKREIPEEWNVGSLLDIAEYTNGIACQKYRPTDNDCLKVIKIKEMHDGFTNDTEFVRSNIPKNVIVEDGDVLFSWSASLEVQMWAGGKGGLNQHIFKVTSNRYPKYFYYFQLLNYVQHFKRMAENRKTTMGHITQDHLKQSRIIIPSLPIIQTLGKHTEPILSNIVHNKVQNQQLINIRDWLLPMLMNGQVKVEVVK